MFKPVGEAWSNGEERGESGSVALGQLLLVIEVDLNLGIGLPGWANPRLWLCRLLDLSFEAAFFARDGIQAGRCRARDAARQRDESGWGLVPGGRVCAGERLRKE
jgi:hypothetical protein